MEDGFNRCPIHKVHDKARNVLEDKLGYSSKRVNLKTALEASLSTNEPVAEIAKKLVPGFEEMNAFEQELVVEYVLVADLLKRGLWSELKDTTLRFVDSEDFIDVSSELKPGVSLRNNQKNQKLSWADTIDTSTQIIGETSILFFHSWEEKMRAGDPDKIKKMRFDELDAMCALRHSKYGTNYTPGHLMRIGFSTGIEYPMGMLKSMPDLLKASGKEPTIENIEKAFSKNLVSVTTQYASQDILSFQAISNSLEPVRMGGDYSPTNFSPDFFILDDEGKMHFKKDSSDDLLKHIEKNVDNTTAKDHVAVNKLFNSFEGKSGEELEVAWKSCPAMFGNQIADFDNFFGPIMKRIVGIQKQYS
jgi:hypothetical protein